MTLTLDDARALVAAAEQQAAGLGITIATTIVDQGGNLLLFCRMDGTQLASSAVSQGKAYTALAWKRPSGALWSIMQPGEQGFGLNAVDPRFVLAAGGVPLTRSGELIGAIGVSGGTQQQDVMCCDAAVAAVMESA